MEYVWVPVTLNPPPALVATVPAVAAVPSPQAIVAVKSEACESGLASVNVATVPLKDVAAVALTGVAVAVRRASVTLKSNARVDARPSLLTKWISPW